MKPIALDPENVTAERVAGCVLCHDVISAGDTGRVKLSKGRVLQAEDAQALRAFSGEIHLIYPEGGDIHEDEASVRLARAVSGEGIELRGPVESQTSLRATYRGLVEVRTEVLHELNCLPDVSVYTAYDGQPADQGKPVGATKVTPLVVAAAVVERAEAMARQAGPVVRVLPFLGKPVGVLVRERLAGTARDRFESAIYMKVGWFGSPLSAIRYLPDDSSAIAAAIERFLADGVALILAAGVNSTDPLDLTIRALEQVGAQTERQGVPAHPGSTCWLAYAADVPIFGLALCGMFSRNTVLDLLLPRFLSGRRVRAADIAGLGHGGLLGKEMAFRFPPYQEMEIPPSSEGV